MTFSFRHLFAASPVGADPIDHPDLRRMSLRELADLPLPRCRADATAPAPREAEPPR